MPKQKPLYIIPQNLGKHRYNIQQKTDKKIRTDFSALIILATNQIADNLRQGQHKRHSVNRHNQQDGINGKPQKTISVFMEKILNLSKHF
jgi:hypothetical protein